MNRIPVVIATPVLAYLVVHLLFLASATQAGNPGTPHYPDLQTLPPNSFHVQRDSKTGARTLFFSNTIANLGQGPLRVRPVNNATTGTTDAYQQVLTHDANGNWYLYAETKVGTFVFHPAHNHWHFEDFALYELRDVSADGSIGPNVITSSNKISFCMTDSYSVDNNLEHYAPRTYVTCSQNDIQGISVGWADIYGWSLPGQSLDVSNIPNGTYWLVSTADPDNLIAETNDANNTGAVKIQIRGNNVKVVK